MGVRFGGCGVQLGGSWRVLGGAGAHFGRPWAGLGRSWGVLGRTLWGRWRHWTPSCQTNVTREAKQHFVRIPLPPFRGKMSPRGAPREPKWRPEGAKAPQNGAQEAPKWIKKRIRSETQNMQKTSEGRSKIDFWRPGGGAKGAEKRQKRASRKVKEGREAKLGSRGL